MLAHLRGDVPQALLKPFRFCPCSEDAAERTEFFSAVRIGLCMRVKDRALFFDGLNKGFGVVDRNIGEYPMAQIEDMAGTTTEFLKY